MGEPRNTLDPDDNPYKSPQKPPDEPRDKARRDWNRMILRGICVAVAAYAVYVGVQLLDLADRGMPGAPANETVSAVLVGAAAIVGIVFIGVIVWIRRI